MYSTVQLHSLEIYLYEGSILEYFVIVITMENTIESPASHDQSQEPKISSRYRHIINKNSVSLVVSAIIGVIGVIILLAGRQDKTAVAVSHFFLSCGIFAFAGGFTNWLAIFMLFNRIPWIYGSG